MLTGQDSQDFSSVNNLCSSHQKSSVSCRLISIQPHVLANKAGSGDLLVSQRPVFLDQKEEEKELSPGCRPLSPVPGAESTPRIPRGRTLKQFPSNHHPLEKGDPPPFVFLISFQIIDKQINRQVVWFKKKKRSSPESFLEHPFRSSVWFRTSLKRNPCLDRGLHGRPPLGLSLQPPFVGGGGGGWREEETYKQMCC